MSHKDFKFESISELRVILPDEVWEDHVDEVMRELVKSAKRNVPAKVLNLVVYSFKYDPETKHWTAEWKYIPKR